MFKLILLSFIITFSFSNENIIELDKIIVNSCNDKNEYTENDTMINNKCKGTPVQYKGDKTITCKNMPIGETFKIKDTTYTVVDNETIKDRTLDYKNVCTTNVTDMSNLFSRTLFNEDISHWDTSNVVNMKFLFAFDYNFNQNLNNWDTTNVVNMYGLFYRSHSFNKPLNNWSIQNVQNFSHIFAYTNFNQDLNNWNPLNATEMHSMFYQSKFNKDISHWKTPNLIENPRLFNFHGNMWDHYKPKQFQN